MWLFRILPFLTIFFSVGVHADCPTAIGGLFDGYFGRRVEPSASVDANPKYPPRDPRRDDKPKSLSDFGAPPSIEFEIKPTRKDRVELTERENLRRDFETELTIVGVPKANKPYSTAQVTEFYHATRKAIVGRLQTRSFEPSDTKDDNSELRAIEHAYRILKDAGLAR